MTSAESDLRETLGELRFPNDLGGILHGNLPTKLE